MIHDLQVVTLSSECPGDGGGSLVLRSHLGGTCGGGRLDDFHRGEVLLQPNTTLCQCLRMRVELANLTAAVVPDEAVLDRHDDLRDNFQRTFHEQIERVSDHALG